MNKTGTILLICGLLLLACVSRIQADPVRNGGWWSKLNDFQRQAYVTGVFDGLTAELILMAGDKVSAQVAWNEGQRHKQMFNGITSDEVIKRLERFYKNRRNQPVLTGDAITLVVLEGRITRDLMPAYQEALDDARKRGAKGW